MSEVMKLVADDSRLKIEWEIWKQTKEFASTRHWARYDEHLMGSLWEAFRVGFEAAKEASARLHENVDPASDDERLSNSPGAGAMGAVIEYRDKIRGQ